jgi:hypothetical protein
MHPRWMVPESILEKGKKGDRSEWQEVKAEVFVYSVFTSTGLPGFR